MTPQPNATQYDADVAAVETEMPCTFYFPVESEKPLTGQKTPTMESLLGGDAGYSQEYDFELLCRRSLWTGATKPPVSEQEISVVDENGNRNPFIVKNVSISPCGTMLTFGIKQNN